MEDLGLYIHIPFCKSKCYYCDFNSYSGKEDIQDVYVDCLIEEIKRRSDLMDGYNLKTIFIGGGTPTYLNLNAIERLLLFLKDYAKDDVEYTCEANPGTLSAEKLKLMKENGINRLSIGLQSWNDRILKLLGRIHSVDEFIENYNQARRLGFNNINVDIMFSFEGQNKEDLESTLDNLINIKPEHISCYSLIIEEGTVFNELYKAGKLKEIDEDTDREMYYMVNRKLEDAGYVHYEISNYAKPGFECRHNIAYWKTIDYLGAGAGAHSLIRGTRFSNETVPEKYISSIIKGNLPVSVKNLLSVDDMMSEYMFMGLRMIEGIDIEEFYKRFGTDIYNVYGDQIKYLIQNGLLMVNKNRLRLTVRGVDLSNQVFVEFIR